MNEHEKINYVEFPAKDIGSALIVFYSKDLEQTQSKIEKAGGKVEPKLTGKKKKLK